jgi:hypothetical protein
VIFDVVQVKLLVVAEILGIGGVTSSVIVIVVVASQPFVPTTVKIYVFGFVTFRVELVPTTLEPSNHEYVPPPLADNAMLVLEQVNTVDVGGAITAFGAVIF